MPVNQVNFLAGAAPDLYSQQQNLAYQQALAQQLMGQGAQTPDPTRSAGRFVVPYTAGEGLTQAGKSIAAALMQKNINQKQSQLAQQQYQRIADLLNPTIQNQNANRAAAGAAGQPAAMNLPQQAQGQPSPAQPQPNPVGDLTKIALASSAFGDKAGGYMASALQPTDLQKNIGYAQQFPGAPTPQAALQHSLDPRISSRGMLFDSSGNLIGGALPPGAIPIQNGQAQLLPNQAAATGQINAATALGKAQGETVEVTTTDGRKVVVPKSAIVGGLPSSSSTSGTPGISPLLQGQSTFGKEFASGAAKSSNEYVDELRNKARDSVDQNRILDEMQSSFQDFNPGKAAAMRKAIAQWRVQMNIAGPEDKQIAASAEVGDKLTGQLVSNALRQLSARPTQMEFQIFKDQFVPNLAMTPQGAQQVINFMRQNNNLSAQKYVSFKKWKQAQPSDADARDFDLEWNPQAARAPLQSPASFPSPSGSPADLIKNTGVIDWSSLGRKTP